MLSDIIVQLELTDPMNLLLHVFVFDYVLREDGLAEVMAQQVASMGDLGRREGLTAASIRTLLLQ